MTEPPPLQANIFHRRTRAGELSIFYREAGPADAPALLLLHGFPSSSRMYNPLLERLCDRFRLIAPDYPGFGHSDWPDPERFDYTFDRLARVMQDFVEAIGLSRYTLYMQDYGGPVGFRMAIAHPERVEAFIVQNAAAHDESLGPLWATRRVFWTDRAAHEQTLRENFLSPAATRARHVGHDPNPELYDPDLWRDELVFLNVPQQSQIQTDLFYDYRTNVAAYPKWQGWLRALQPRLLVLWGKYDPSFEVGEPRRFLDDVPAAEIHMLDAGHFALDTRPDQIAAIVRNFMTAAPDIGGS